MSKEAIRDSDKNKDVILNMFFHKGKPSVLDKDRLFVEGLIKAMGLSASDYQLTFRLLEDDGYLKNDEGQCFPSGKAIRLYSDGGFSVSKSKKTIRWIRQKENIRWMITIASFIISILALILSAKK